MPALQLDALRAAGHYRVFVDTASGPLATRPELEKFLEDVQPEDVPVV